MHSRVAGAEKPRFARTQSFVKLQAYWYRVLREQGFVDIETGRDSNTAKAYKTDMFGEKARVSRIVHFMPDEGEIDEQAMMAANAEVFGTYTNVADTPTAVAWRVISKCANDLPLDYPHRLFLIDVAQVGCVALYLLQRHRMTRRVALATFARFLDAHGLDTYHGILVQGPVSEATLERDPREAAWREIAAAAQALRTSPRLRLFVLEVCEAGGLTRHVSRKYDFDDAQARRVFLWFLNDQGLGKHRRLLREAN